MAIRQYIGARYVLKIYENSTDPQSAEWEPGVVYEPLVMVNYNNSSYISKKTVPANIGNPVSNPSYWALSGLYNGQIAHLETEVNRLLYQVPRKAEDIRKGTWIFIGDSFDAITSGWIDTAASRIKVEHYIKVSEGGAGFLGRGIGTNKTWLELLQDAAIPDYNDVRYICIVGGGNDNGQPLADLNTAIANFNTYINATFPNLDHVYIGYCGYSRLGTSGAGNAFTGNIRYQTSAAQYGWTYLDNMIGIPFNPLNMLDTDPSHPNSRGLDRIVQGVTLGVLGDYNYYDFNVFTGTIDTNYMTFGSGVQPTINFTIDRKNTQLAVTVAGKFGTFASGHTSGTLSKFITFTDYTSPFRTNKTIVLTGYVLSSSQMVLLPLVPNASDQYALDLVFPAGFDIGALGVVIPDQTFITTV